MGPRAHACRQTISGDIWRPKPQVDGCGIRAGPARRPDKPGILGLRGKRCLCDLAAPGALPIQVI